MPVQVYRAVERENEEETIAHDHQEAWRPNQWYPRAKGKRKTPEKQQVQNLLFNLMVKLCFHEFCGRELLSQNTSLVCFGAEKPECSQKNETGSFSHTISKIQLQAHRRLRPNVSCSPKENRARHWSWWWGLDLRSKVQASDRQMGLYQIALFLHRK